MTAVTKRTPKPRQFVRIAELEVEVAGLTRGAGRPRRVLVPGVARAIRHCHRARRRLAVGVARGAARARRRPVRVRGARLAGGGLVDALRRPLLASRARAHRPPKTIERILTALFAVCCSDR